MWSDPVKHWEERLDTNTHIFFRESKFQDWSAYGAIQSVGGRETLKGPAIADLTQPTISVTQDAFFALGMGCPSPDIAMKYRVSRGMQRSRAWCGTPPILGVVNMVGTRNFTCYMGAL